MMRRRRGPSLLGVAATAAVVSSVTTNKAQQSQAQAQAQQQAAYNQGQLDAQQAAPPPAAAAPAAPAPAGGITSAQMAELQQLSALKDQGILTQEEFDRQKAKILG